MGEPVRSADAEAGQDAAAQARRFVAGLFDFQFRELVAPRMLPTIYVLGTVLAVLFTLYLVVQAFRSSWVEGLVWLLLLGPAVLLALITALRIGLESLLAIFRLVLHVERLDDIAHRIQGQTEEIATDLPRIRFWRAFGRSRKADE